VTPEQIPANPLYILCPSSLLATLHGASKLANLSAAFGKGLLKHVESSLRLFMGLVLIFLPLLEALPAYDYSVFSALELKTLFRGNASPTSFKLVLYSYMPVLTLKKGSQTVYSVLWKTKVQKDRKLPGIEKGPSLPSRFKGISSESASPTFRLEHFRFLLKKVSQAQL
jgi:hypothetical protein